MNLKAALFEAYSTNPEALREYREKNVPPVVGFKVKEKIVIKRSVKPNPPPLRKTFHLYQNTPEYKRLHALFSERMPEQNARELIYTSFSAAWNAKKFRHDK